ncbi:hypothetical protein GIY30_15735 [Gordonia sp. HNM0687]|uniref:Uncharacterized protein n=1 Tax=Gordonia mangrovi TaxID=2665643 RepID=A0A6L7GTJ7_9ACTN|nr:hypothetical protein [Gordonia mangrovi]MXP22792.1 hypothetical protein [Gordonia mangrovi]UVF77107.1 hypothetical protein NWF22_17535 [Gordonia mangrovi]
MADIWQQIPKISEYGTWMDPKTYLRNLGDPVTAVAIALLQKPRFEEVEGCVILAGSDHDNVRDWLRQLPDRQSVEEVVNHVHLWDILPGLDSMPTVVALTLGEWLAWGWERAASEQYPDREFRAEAREGDYGVEVTVSQAHAGGSV